MILRCLCRGLTLCLMVGPWSGTRPRPTQTPPSDIMLGLAWYLNWRRVQCPCFKHCCKTWNFKRFCNNFHQLILMLLLKYSCTVSACDVKMWWHLYLWTHLRARYLVWPCIRWFIGTLPDRPKDYTIWSTLEPSRVDSRTWAGVIQVGSATVHLCNFKLHVSVRKFTSVPNVTGREMVPTG
jgi:hypothetical protein